MARSVTVASAGRTGDGDHRDGPDRDDDQQRLALAVVLLPGLISPTGFPPGAVLVGGLAHLRAAAAGSAVGLVTSRPLIWAGRSPWPLW